MKWSRRSDNIIKLNDINEIVDLEINDSVVVLPEDNKIEEAIDLITTKYEIYVEYLHWNNNGKRDGFINHRNNMFVLNDDYEKRKAIGDKLFEIYHVEDFNWKNQSVTSLASLLFKIQNGYLPESSYNSRVREILDKFEPRALYFCDGEYFDEEEDQSCKDFGICKSYPNVLIKNEQTTPVYSIHDKIEEFTDIRDLEKTGEFYIDEVILDKYGCDLKKEAGFYSISLIKYLVQVLKMDQSNIKYKIVTKRALKPDTFKSFI